MLRVAAFISCSSVRGGACGPVLAFRLFRSAPRFRWAAARSPRRVVLSSVRSSPVGVRCLSRPVAMVALPWAEPCFDRTCRYASPMARPVACGIIASGASVSVSWSSPPRRCARTGPRSPFRTGPFVVRLSGAKYMCRFGVRNSIANGAKLAQEDERVNQNPTSKQSSKCSCETVVARAH